MDNLPKNATQLRECISRIRPWVAVASLCAAVLLGFYSLQGLQYWNAWNDVRTMSDEIERISNKLERGVPESGVSDQDLELRQQRLGYLKGLYQYSDSAGLMGIVSTTSWETGVDLPSISAADPTSRELDGMTYQVQVISVNARGGLPEIYRFMATLQERVKVVSTPNLSISNPSSLEAAAQAQLTFYLTPKPIPGSNGAD